MYSIYLTLRATGALSFRTLPGSILDINTYPFVPPSTLSGWLYRVWRYASSIDSPDGPDFLETGLRDSPFYYLPRTLTSLGAYPIAGHHQHRTRRHGTKGFSSRSRSALVTDDMEAPQLHTWEYLVAETFVGYIVSEDLDALTQLLTPLVKEEWVIPYGGKLGKEGYAYLENISRPVELEARVEKGEASTLLTLEEATQGVLDFKLFTLYRPVWKGDHRDWFTSAPVEGFEQLPLVLPERGALETEWWVGEGIRIPKTLVGVFA